MRMAIFAALISPLLAACMSIGTSKGEEGYANNPPKDLSTVEVGILGAGKPPLDTCCASSVASGGFGRDPDYAVVPVFFATDRAPSRRGAKDGWFGSGRGTVKYGISEVSIPRDHRMGQLESPSILRFEFSEDPKKHVMVQRTIVTSERAFYSNLSASIGAAKKKSTFLFIHGYNVSFKEAARRTAQIAYDLGFDGAPVLYSWPSRGVPAAYTYDENEIAWTQANLEAFLKQYVERSGAESIYLIAHSMGNRALTGAFTALAERSPATSARIKEVILTAPDIDAEIFKRDIAPVLARSGRPVTLYASSRDRALMLSRRFHGQPRAGDSDGGVVIASGIETIDATSVDTDFLGHSYIGEKTLLADMHEVFDSGNRAEKRFGLVERDTDQGRYWTFRE